MNDEPKKSGEIPSRVVQTRLTLAEHKRLKLACIETNLNQETMIRMAINKLLTYLMGPKS